MVGARRTSLATRPRGASAGARKGGLPSMKAVILAGGHGTRLSEETSVKPKPMVEIGGHPILWHIMKIYGHYGVRDFVICLGYKGYVIKEFFANYLLHTANLTFDLAKNAVIVHEAKSEPWRVTLVDTGPETMTGGRLLRVAPYLRQAPFLLTYGDGLADVDIPRTLEFHRSHGLAVTMTVAQPPGRFGQVTIRSDVVTSFTEKPAGDGGWINAGFFVMSPDILKYISGDATSLEREPLESLARNGQLAAYRHRGFWLPMDTMRDKELLESLWTAGDAPWKIWR